MKALARALINAAAYLELASEDGYSASALEALEEMAYNLAECTDAEKRALEEVLADMRAAEVEGGARPEVLDFLDTFMTCFGLTGEEPPSDADDSPRINLL
jgi:hypothetical protein